MTWTEAALILTALGSLGLAVWTVVKERRKPQLDEAQTAAVRAEVQKSDRSLNLWRDRRILDLESWGDHMRPWASAMDRRDEQMMVLITTAYERLGWPVPAIEPKPAMPKFPEPREL